MNQKKAERTRITKVRTADKPPKRNNITQILRSVDNRDHFKDFKKSLNTILKNFNQESKKKEEKKIRKVTTNKHINNGGRKNSYKKTRFEFKTKSQSLKSLGKFNKKYQDWKRKSSNLPKKKINTRFLQFNSAYNKQNVQSLTKNVFSMRGLEKKKGGSTSKKAKFKSNAFKNHNRIKLSSPNFLKIVPKKTGPKKKKVPGPFKPRNNLDGFVTRVKEVKEADSIINLPKTALPFSKEDFPKEQPLYYMVDLHNTLNDRPCDLPSEIKLAFQQHFNQTLQSLAFFKKLKLEGYKSNGLSVELGPSPKNQKTLVFDLDETLIHCKTDQSGPCDAKVPVTFPGGETIMAGINIRPFAKEILKKLSKHFELIIFTASHSCYANPVIDYIDEEGVVVKRLFRENCSQVTEGLFTKDLTVFKDRRLEDIILVDNAVYSFFFQLGNGVPIVPFTDFKGDRELIKLERFLMGLKEVEDVREDIEGAFKWKNSMKYALEPERLFKEVGERKKES